MSDYPQMPPAQPQPVQSGLSDDAASGLAYLTIIPAIIFLVVAPYNQSPKIRFHCWQSIFLAICWFGIGIIMIVPILGWILGMLGFLCLFIVWIISIIKAFQGGRFMIPVIGALAAKQAGA